MTCVKRLTCTHCNKDFQGFLNEIPRQGITYTIACPKCCKQNSIKLGAEIVDSPVVPSDAVEIKRAT